MEELTLEELKKRGRLLCVRSFDHDERQLVEHARLVFRKLGYRERKIDLGPNSVPNINQLAEELRIAYGRPLTAEELAYHWLHARLIRCRSQIEEMLEQGDVVFAEFYLPEIAAALAVVAAEDGREIPAFWAMAFCDKCNLVHSIHPVDAGVIVVDPRLDNVLVRYHDGIRPNVPYGKRYLARRNMLLNLVKEDPHWKTVTAGKPELEIDTDTQRPIRDENGVFWREYWDVELEMMRHLLPEEVELSDDDILELLGQVRFDRAEIAKLTSIHRQ